MQAFIPSTSTLAVSGKCRLTCRLRLLGLLVPLICAFAAQAQQNAADLSSESLEDLMNIQVTSVSREEQKLSRTASAVFVVTQEDIQRSGATNIPDALRMVPGLDVAQINGNTWAVSARGMNGRFSNKLLVLLDGRTVYTPTFGGVFWDVLDLPLRDVDRIEVIRGPGGSIWGANAVNGVINIITREASDTKGSVVETGGGNVDEVFGTVQYGGHAGGTTDYRVYLKYFNQDHLAAGNGETADDGWHLFQGGFRTDSTLSAKDKLSVQGGIYSGREGQEEPHLASITSAPLLAHTEVNMSGGFLQAVWKHTFSSRSDTTLQASYDGYERDDVLWENRRTFDVDFQHHFSWGARQDIVWGGDYRYSRSNARGSLFIRLNPAILDFPLFSAFVQDDIAISPDRLYLTLGAKLEHNHYTGFNAMPTARLAWLLSTDQTLWAAVSRVVRTPAETDAGIRVNVGGFVAPDGTPAVIGIIGNPNLKGEELVAYEAGYRASVARVLSFDFAAYLNSYHDQETTEPAPPFFETTPAPAHLLVPLQYQNLMYGESHGLEVFANWSVSDRWMLSPGYAFEQIHMHLDPASQDNAAVAQAQGSTPVHSAQLRSHVVLPKHFAWDSSAYFVDRIADPAIPSYTRVDTSLTWHWGEKRSITVVGQNLVADRRLEYIDLNGSTNSTSVKRGVYAKVDWLF